MTDKLKKRAIVFDTDPGLDDAAAFLLWAEKAGFTPDYIVAATGNSPMSCVLKNALILKKYLGLQSKIVRGYETPDAEVLMSTFHGPDGLAGMSDELVEKLKLSDAELSDYLSFEAFRQELSAFEEILVIAVGPVLDLAVMKRDPVIGSRITEAYVMGGGLSEFNMPHDTEFNFSRFPEAVKELFESDMKITLFPLDLTDCQYLTEAQISELEAYGTYPEYIRFLRYNRQSNREDNGIDGAVLHDTMPVFYAIAPEKFELIDTKLLTDAYGHIEENEAGRPVRIAIRAEEGLLFDTMKQIFQGAAEKEKR